MKTLEALAALQALNVLGTTGEPVPLKFAYASVRNRRTLGDLAQVYETKRKELLEKYGKKDKNGKLKVKINAETQVENVLLADTAAFSAAFAELGETDVEDLELHKVALADFPEKIELPLMEALMVLVLEPGEQK